MPASILCQANKAAKAANLARAVLNKYPKAKSYRASLLI